MQVGEGEWIHSTVHAEQNRYLTTCSRWLSAPKPRGACCAAGTGVVQSFSDGNPNLGINQAGGTRQSTTFARRPI